MSLSNKNSTQLALTQEKFVKYAEEIFRVTNALLKLKEIAPLEKIQTEITFIQQAVHELRRQAIENLIVPKDKEQSYEITLNKICHDLYNPVNAIKGYTELLAEELNNTANKNIKGYLDRMVVVVNKINQLIHQLNPKAKIRQYQTEHKKLPAVVTKPTLLNETAGKDCILVVDDENLNLNLMEDWLVSRGYETIKAQSGPEALALLQQHPKLDLLMLDMMMPGMSGLEILQKIRQDPAYNDLPIIMLSAVYDVTSIAQCIKNGADDYILKPFDSYLLSARIRASLDRKRLRDQEHESRARLQLISDSLPVLICAIDHNLIFTFTNKAFEDWFEMPLAEIVGKHISNIFPAKICRNIEKKIQALGTDNSFVHFELAMSYHNKAERTLAVTLTPHVVEGLIKSIFITMSDITYLKETEEKLSYMAVHDPLTGLPNRNLLDQCLTLAVNAANEYQTKFAILFLDLDQFKLINDNLGHEFGDSLLKEAAERIKSCLRSTDTIIRMGGDEFLIVIEAITGKEQVSYITQKICQTIAAPFLINGHVLNTSASIGISLYPDNSVDKNNLIRYADLAMYYVKENYRNNYHFYKEALENKAASKLMVSNELRKALDKNEFSFHYQPIYDLKTGTITHLEALIRWDHPSNGILLPAVFLPHAEETGLIFELNKLVIRSICRQNKLWQAKGLTPIPIAVNISPRQFQEGNLVTIINNVLQEEKLTGKYLQIEIVENTLLSNPEISIAMMQNLKELQIKIFIDDFGTGYSSLSYLRRLPIDGIKVDISFIRDLDKSEDADMVVKSIINLSHNLKLKVVAEGVETQAQYKFLLKNNCDMAQGNFFCAPLAAEQILQELLRNKQTLST